MANHHTNHTTHKRKTRAASAPVVGPKDVSVRGAVVVVEDPVEQKNAYPHDDINPAQNPGNIEDDHRRATLVAEDQTPGEENNLPDGESKKDDYP